MVTKEKYSQALKDYCDHINKVKKIDNAMDKMKLVNKYWKQQYEKDNTKSEKGKI